MASDSVHPPLRDFQTWMQTFIVSSGSPQEAIRAAEELSGLAPGSAERLVQRSATLDEMERLMIYRRMYPLRMEEALSIDFPVVRKLLGRETFFRLVEEYVEAFPSRSWTLDHLGQHMVRFVETHPLTEKYPGLWDLVRLEQALCDVFNAEDSGVLTPEELAEVSPEQWPEARFDFVPAFILLELGSNANDLYKAYNQARDLPKTHLGTYHLVVWREGFQTWRMPLVPAAFAVLKLLHEGASLGEALEKGLDDSDESPVFEWFQTWVGEGFFRSLRLSELPPSPPTPSSVSPKE